MKILVTMPPLPEAELKQAWGKVIAASRGSDMTMDRAYMNIEEGFATCCWNAPTKDALAELFSKAGTPFEKMVAVQEFSPESVPTE